VKQNEHRPDPYPVLSKNRNDTKPGPFGGVWALGSDASQPIDHDL